MEMEKATGDTTNARYNDEVLFLDGVAEFHPEVLEQLNEDERTALETYYLTGQPTPDNIFEYRKALVDEQPEIETVAQAAFKKLLIILDIEEFTYTTRVEPSD